MVERSYDALTVSDICEAADVGRSAFYAHFAGKDDLMRAGFERLEADLATSAGGARESVSARFFAHAAAHRALYRAMTHSQAAPITAMSVRRIMRAQLEAELDGSPAGAPLSLRVQVLVDLMMTVTGWWLDHEPLAPVEQVERVFRELAAGILVSAARPSSLQDVR